MRSWRLTRCARAARAGCHKVVTKSAASLYCSRHRRPGSPGSYRCRRARARPVGWRVLSCPDTSFAVTHSPQPTPSAAPPYPAAMADPLVLFRWLDVILVVLAAPFVVLMGLPVLGYVGRRRRVDRSTARSASLVERVATRQDDVRRAVGLNLGALIARSWLVGLTILAVGLAGEREDGLMAAVLLLAAFTAVLRHLAAAALAGREDHAPMSTRKKILLGIAGVYIVAMVVVIAHLRRHPARQRGVPAAERVQARHLDRAPGPVRLQQGRACTC